MSSSSFVVVKSGSDTGLARHSVASYVLFVRARRCFEQTLDLNIQIPGDGKSGLAIVRSEQAGHRVVGKVHAVITLVNENRDGRVRRGVGDGLGHLFHDERITNDEAKHLESLSTMLFAQHLADVKADELH